MGKNHGKRSKPRDWKKYNRFRILERVLILPLISKIVDALPPPYKVKEKGSVGRPSANPRTIVKVLLFKALNGLSYFSAFSELQGSLEDREALGIDHLPARSTVQSHVIDISQEYLQDLIGMIVLMIMNIQGRIAVNAAGDSTGFSTQMYGRWYTAKYGDGSRRQYIKLHALCSADTDMPFFIAAKATPSNCSDTRQLEPMLEMLSVKVNEVYLDKGYLSRANAQLIADKGAVPYIAVRKDVRAYSLGYPAWHKMISNWREDKESYDMHYNRRSIIEGIFSAVKRRMSQHITSKLLHNQEVEAMCKAVIWNMISLIYHMA